MYRDALYIAMQEHSPAVRCIVNTIHPAFADKSEGGLGSISNPLESVLTHFWRVMQASLTCNYLTRFWLVARWLRNTSSLRSANKKRYLKPLFPIPADLSSSTEVACIAAARPASNTNCRHCCCAAIKHAHCVHCCRAWIKHQS